MSMKSCRGYARAFQILLFASLLADVFTQPKTVSGQEVQYGIGWFLHKSHAGKWTYEHSGGSVGGTWQLILYPDSNVVIALVTNLSDAPWKRDEVEAIAEKFADESKDW